MNRKSVFWLALILLSALPLFAQFAGGTGTEQSPWQVATADHLNNVRSYLDGHFIQTADIDLGVAPWNEGAGWAALGQYSHLPFEGNYNGNGHTISGLYVNSMATTTTYKGLFGSSVGTIQNLHLTDVDLKTNQDYLGALLSINNGTIINCSSSGTVKCDWNKQFIGGLVGVNYGDIIDCHSSGNVTPDTNNFTSKSIGGLVGLNGDGGSITGCHSTATVRGGSEIGGLVGGNKGDITDCHSSGIITGNSSLGGLVGISTSGSITSCHSTSEVTGVSSLHGAVGGLVGTLSPSDGESIITNCYSAGQVTGVHQNTGGLVGYSYGGEINGCYSSGSVTGGTNSTGGLVGLSYSSTSPYVTYINNCYSSATVSGDSTIGGLVGYNHQSTITNSYSNGHVSGNSAVGGMVGSSMIGIYNNCYWDIQVSGQATSSGGAGRLTAEMVFPHSDDTYIGWDWEIWATDTDHVINDGYPYLRAFHDDVSSAELIAPPSASLIRVFPQPAFQKPSISIKSPSSGELSYSIYNIRGQRLYCATVSASNKEQLVELPNEAWNLLSNGVYLVNLEQGKRKIASSRMVVIK